MIESDGLFDLQVNGYANVDFNNAAITASQLDDALQAMRNRFDDRIHVHGPSGTEMRRGIISFGFDHIHAHDISQVLDEDAICVRASHHCAKPLMRVLGVPANTRASFYVYNDEADVDALIDGLERAEKFFAI